MKKYKIISLILNCLGIFITAKNNWIDFLIGLISSFNHQRSANDANSSALID